MRLLRGFWSTDRSLSLLVLSLALVIFVVPPLQQLGLAGRLLVTLFFSFLLLSGVAAVAKTARTTVVVGGLVLATLVVRLVRLWLGGGSLVMSDALFSALFCIIMAVVVLAQVLREGPITVYRIEGAVAFYLLLGLAWAFAYELVELHWSNAFVLPSWATTNPNDDPTGRFVYFSFVTLTTVGYGDITAVHPLARSLVTLEALVGQLFPAILLARLVSMELYHRQAQDREAR
ncbi:MAG TPA: potassium channel family protein [Candidatus Margulisiibacteriota bacterium]|nr:potassium channel family protein [Candidatus Margulisiibacteriota bacterium]